MPRNIDDIQRDIVRTRRQLAKTLDELADRTKPKNVVEDAKTSMLDKLREPQVQKVLAGIGVAVTTVVVLGVLRSRKRSKDIKELHKLLVTR